MRPPTALCLATRPLLASSPPRHHMPPRRRESLGYHGVRERPSGTFYAEICSNDMRLGLGTFDTADQAARAYGTTAWRLQRPRREMNFLEVMTLEWAQRLWPPPRVVTEEDHRQNRRRVEGRAERAAYHEDRRMRKQAALFNIELKGPSTWDPDDERWTDDFITTEESDTSASEKDNVE
ncbi:hypothetical protein D1007_55602 [Hordeum vulgare]|nr:hypothetical protein D1007_55602 [Hordeum vulgare]